MKSIAFGKADPSWDWKAFDFDKDPARLADARKMLNATDPDLSPFRSRGGKLLMYFGWADTALTPYMAVDYYETGAGGQRAGHEGVLSLLHRARHVPLPRRRRHRSVRRDDRGDRLGRARRGADETQRPRASRMAKSSGPDRCAPIPKWRATAARAASTTPPASPVPIPAERRANDAFWPVHEHGHADLVGSAGALAAPREDRMGHRLRHRPLLPEHQGARGRHARIVEHAERAGRAGAAHARGHDRARQHVSPSGGGRQDGGAGRHHLRRPAAAGAGRRLAAERARGLRHSLLHDEGAAGAPGRGVPGDALAVDRASQQLQGPVLPALGRAARSQARAVAASRS